MHGDEINKRVVLYSSSIPLVSESEARLALNRHMSRNLYYENLDGIDLKKLKSTYIYKVDI